MGFYIKYLVALVWIASLTTGQSPTTLDIDEKERSNKTLVEILDTYKDLSSVTYFFLRNSRVKTLTANIMSRFPNLKFFEIRYSELEDFEPGVFRDNKNLDTIAFPNNQIQNLSNLFTALNNSPSKDTLTMLDLKNNKIEELIQFPSLRILKYVYFSENNLRKLDGNVFRNLRALDRLQLQQNSITSITPMSFNFLTDPDRNFFLNLQYNKFQSLSEVLDGIADAFIDTLDLEKNNIEQIREIDSKIKVRKLLLSYNNIADLGTTPLVKDNYFLKELELDRNPIKSIGKQVFSALNLPLKLSMAFNSLENAESIAGLEGKLIEELNLNGNQLSTVTKFPRIEILSKLSLALNLLKNVDSGFFQDLPSLRTIDLSNNQIESIKADTFKINNNPNKLSLSLDYNKLSNFSETMAALADVPIEDLNLDYNSIKALSDIPLMVHLKNISLESNNLNDLSRGYFKNAPNLKRIKLGSNQISDLSPEFIESIRNVEFLGLTGNDFQTVPKLKYFNGSSLKDIDFSFQRLPVKITENAFERMVEPSKALEPIVFSFVYTEISEVSPRAFCSNYTDSISIRKIQVPFDAMKLIDKCTLRQLRKTTDLGVEVMIPSSSAASEQEVADFCGCGFTRLFAMKYNIRFTGICEYYQLVKCSTDPSLIRDDCDMLPEFKCPRDDAITTTTAAPTTAVSQPSTLSPLAIAGIVIGAGLLLIVAIALPFIFNRMK